MPSQKYGRSDCAVEPAAAEGAITINALAGDELWNQEALALITDPGDRFGDALAAGDFVRVLRMTIQLLRQAAHALPFEAILLAMVVEQAKEIERLKRLRDG